MTKRPVFRCKLRNAFALSVLIVLAAGSAGVSRAQAPPPAPALKPVRPGKAPANPYTRKQIARGKLLVVSSGCNDCHTPWIVDPELGVPAPDWTRMLSGRPVGHSIEFSRASA